METVLQPSNYNNFPEGDRITTFLDGTKKSYEFLPFHPVSVTSEMVGTSLEELLMHNFPTKRSWECSRLCDFPQEVIVRMNFRCHFKYICVKTKVYRPIPELDLYIGDGISGSFVDCEYRKLGKVQNINEEGMNIKVDGIGNYLKLVFTKAALKTPDNPFGQVSLSQLKIFGKKVDHLIFNSTVDVEKDSIDKILINLGLPLNDPSFFITEENYYIAPVDEDTKITLRDLFKILYKADKTKDFEILKKIKKDIKIVFQIGNEILNIERKLQIAKSKEDFDSCIKLRALLEEVIRKRNNYDAIYETSRYEDMIVMKRPTTAELLEEEQTRLREERERLEREKQEKEKLERERRRREEEEELNRRFAKKEKFVDAFGENKFVEYVDQRPVKKKEEFSDELQYNQGDRDLEPYFNPLARDAGGNIPTPDISKLRKALRGGILTCTGVRLYSALISENWKLREAAVKALLEFIENPLIPRYFNKTLNLFLSCIEVAKVACDDKVIQIYVDGLKLLSTCLAPPICGNDIDPGTIQKSVAYFIPRYIKKISELNLRARDLTMNTLISIFKHPALNIGDLVKGCMDLVEKQESLTPDKQPANALLARLEVVLHILEDYGIDESLWDWYPVFTELIIPSLFHQNPSCRLVAIEICVLLYKIVGDDIKIIINDLGNLKPNLKENITSRFSEVDEVLKKELNLSQQIDTKSKNFGKSTNSLHPIMESNLEKDT